MSATTDAVTLARYDWSETSQVAVMLTREHGKARLLSKGAKRPRRGVSNEIDLLVRCRIVFYPRVGTDLDLLGSYEVYGGACARKRSNVSRSNRRAQAP